MKKVVLIMLFALLAISVDAYAKNIKEAKLSANMTCETCKGKIEETLKKEQGVVKSNADVASKTVTVSYDASKTNETKIKNSIAKLGYTVEDAAKTKPVRNVGSDCGTRCSKSCGGKK